MKILPIAIAAGLMAVLFLSVDPLQMYADSRCKSVPNPSNEIMELGKFTWISVVKISKNQTNLDCTYLSPQFLSTLPKLQGALEGAAKCTEGHGDLCSVGTNGVMLTTVYRFGVPVTDSVNYEASMTQGEAKILYDNIRLASNGAQSYGDVKYGNSYYQIVLLTSNTERAPQVHAEFARQFSSNPITIQKGQSLSFPITLTTLATYGRQAHIQFDTSTSSLDSKLGLRVEPPEIEMPERSVKNVTLIVTATPKTRDGTYGINVGGRTDTGGGFSACQFECLTVSVNDSKWEIRTYPGNAMIGIGGNSAPKWLSLESRINKDVFGKGDIAKVTNYLTNNGSGTASLSEHAELVVTVYSESPEKGYQYYYVIQATYDGKKLEVPPHSTVLLARPFYMDLTSYHDNPNVLQRLAPGNYTVDIVLSGYDGDRWNNDIPIVVR